MCNGQCHIIMFNNNECKPTFQVSLNRVIFILRFAVLSGFVIQNADSIYKLI